MLATYGWVCLTKTRNSLSRDDGNFVIGGKSLGLIRVQETAVVEVGVDKEATCPVTIAGEVKEGQRRWVNCWQACILVFFFERSTI